MKKYFILMLLLPGILKATPIAPSINGAKGLHHIMSADLGYPGIFHFKLSIRAATSDLGVYHPYPELDSLRLPTGNTLIDSSLSAIDTYFGGSFDFALGWAVTRWLEINVRGRYWSDYIDCDDTPHLRRIAEPYENWFYNGWENRASTDRGDTDIGAKFVFGSKIALYPYVSIPTGTERNDTLYDASYFTKRTRANHGGLFRYFTNGKITPGISLLLSNSTKTESPISGYLNLGYKMNGGDANEYTYGLGADILFFDYFDPFVEFWGSRRSFGEDPFGDHPPSYVTLGMKFIGKGINADIGVDFLVLGKRDYDFLDFAQYPDDHVTTGWGARPTWAINLAFGYSYDFYNMRPITNKGMIIGQIVDAITKESIDAIISVTGTQRLISDPLTGVYEAKVSPGKTRVIAVKKGYKSKTKIAMVPRGEKIVVDFALEPIISHGIITGKIVDKWTTKPIQDVGISLSRGETELTSASIEPGTITKTIRNKTYKMNPKTGTWTLLRESAKKEDITTTIGGKLYRLNMLTGDWEVLEGASESLNEEDITMIIDGELHRLNVITGKWENVTVPVKFEDIVKEEDITQTIKGELYKLNVVTNVWEIVKVPTTNVEEIADTIVASNEEGLYQLDLVPPATHHVTVSKEGYISQLSPIVCKANATSVLNFELLAEKIVLRGIHFEFDQANLLVDSYTMLEKLYRFLKDNPKLCVEIGGHTDWVASDGYNMELSTRRADAVRNYLIKHGISPSKIIAKGYGESVPIASNKTDEGRALNRRIELTILKK